MAVRAPWPRLAQVLLLLCMAPFAHAWSSEGHEIVAEVASRHLSSGARQEVERLLGDRAASGMRVWADWPDRIRDQPEFKHTAPLHYLNFPRGNCRYDAARDCRAGGCLVEALREQVARLQAPGEDAARREALAWVIHLVGDAHQPMHAGFADDRGGNTMQLRYNGQGTNLHQLWDRHLVQARGLRPVFHAEMLMRQPRPAGAIQWQAQAPERWVEESCALIDAANIYPRSARIDQRYVYQMQRLAEARLTLAGLRLAEVLNAVLDPLAAEGEAAR